MAAIETWAQLEADNDQAVPHGSPEKHDRDQVNDIVREMMSAVATFLQDGEWIDLTKENGADFTVSRGGIDSFLVVDAGGTDASSKFPVGRWVKLTGTVTPTVAYGQVKTAVYGAPTLTVTLEHIVDANYATSDVPDTSVTKAECHWNSRIRQAAFHPIGKTLAQSPKQIPTIDDLGDVATKNMGATNGIDADMLDGLHAAAFQLAGGLAASRNAVVNASMNIWQRGTSFTTPANSSFIADRWAFLGENASWDFAREATIANLPAGYRYALKMTATGTADKGGVFHILTGANSKQIIDNGKASLSFWIQLPSTAQTIAKVRAAILEWRGTEDVPTRYWMDPGGAGAWSAEGTDPLPDTNWVVANTPSADEHLAIDDWTLVTVENVTINSLARNLGIFIWVEDKTYGIGNLLRITGIKLEPGATATTHVPLLFDADMQLCLPHYRTTYDYPLPAGTNPSNPGRLEHPASRATTFNFGAAQATFDWRFGAPMFKVPTVLTYASGTGAAGFATDASGNVACTAIAANRGLSGVSLLVDGNPAQGELSVHATAEAEL